MKFLQQNLAPIRPPKAASEGPLATYLGQWQEAAIGKEPDIQAFMQALSEDAAGKKLLATLFGNSPYLAAQALRHPEKLKTLCEEGFDAAIEQVFNNLRAIDFAGSKDDIMAAMRLARGAASLVIAVADIYALWPLEKITGTLTKLAEETLSLSVNHLLLKSAQAGNIVLKDTANPSLDCGLVVLGVGKLGSHELNYSSDIDLMFFYDSDKVQFNGRTTVGQFFVRLAQEVASLMQERTKDGYVFRVDLRLRPDPGSTPAAMSIKAAEYYYETVGQNWERAAMIKARPVAGDIDAGKHFIQFLASYIWRKSLDFASIQDIHSIKRQISSKVGKLPDGLLGYNVKLGHGGIREIEFYAQTQQLIWGGRELPLRVPATCEALDVLTKLGKVTPKAFEELTEAYRFYRTVEHRLQMVADQQTHSLPETTEEMDVFAVFMGFESGTEFVKTMTRYLTCVQGHYAKLFETSPSLASEDIEGSLVFTGIENDPETLQTITRMGFQNAAAISENIRGWHHGRARAMRTKRARELLTELTPVLLKELAGTANPDLAFTKFNEFLFRLPAGVQIFSLFHAQPQLLELIAEIMGGYPYIAENLSRKPALLEYVLSSEFFDDLPEPTRLKEKLDAALKQARDYQDVLDICRSWTHDRQFRVGIQFIKQKINAFEASLHLSNIADTVLSILLQHVMEDFARQYGKVGKNSFAVIAMGKLGGREITFASDLDLVFVYDPTGYPTENASLSASEYFMRLSRRFIAAITSLTPEGTLYEVDTRLRPSGNDGAVACSLEAFDAYYAIAREENAAWEWEYMALTRARVLTGGKSISEKIDELIRKKLTTTWDSKLLAKKAFDMRERIAQSGKNVENPLKIKQVRGGIIDVEFIVQYLQLVHGNKKPEVLSQNTPEALQNLVTLGLVEKEDGQALIDAYALYHRLQALRRITGNRDPDEANLSPAGRDILAQADASKDFETLKKRLVTSQKKVHNLFDKFITSHTNP